MAAEIEAIIDRFDTAIVNDPRDTREGSARFVGGFDVHTNLHKLIPFRGVESGDSNSTDSKQERFAVALRSGTTYSLYGLGVVSGTGRAEIEYKDINTGGSSDFSDNGWTATANNTSASGTTSFNVFVYYAQTGLIYGARSGTHIWAYDPSGAVAFANTERAITYTNIAQGLVHSKDDILYIPYDNKIAKNNNGSWTDVALTLPTHLKVTAITEYGNHLAIGCEPLSGVGESVVYLWDRDSSLVELDESINFGEGKLKILSMVSGSLIGISEIGGSAVRFNDRWIVREYVGSPEAEVIDIFESSVASTANALLPFHQKVNNRLYFQGTITLNGTRRQGVFSYGRHKDTREWTFTQETPLNGDTALTSGVPKGFIVVEDYTFQSYVDDSSNYQMTKTHNDATYDYNSLWESGINPRVPSKYQLAPKTLKSVYIAVDAIASGESAELQYRVDGGSWTSIMTISTVGEVVLGATEDSNGDQFESGREYEFKIISTGGATVTGFGTKYDVEDDNYFEG